MKSLIIISVLLSASLAFAGGSCKYNIRTFIPGGMMTSDGTSKGTSMNYEKCVRLVNKQMGDVDFQQLGLVAYEGKVNKQKGTFYSQYQFNPNTKTIIDTTLTAEEYKSMMKEYFGVDVK